MGQFIGTAGGLMMAVAVAALFLRFCRDMGIYSISREETVVLISIVGIGIAELMVCGIYYTVRVPGTSILDLPQIWEDKNLLFSGEWPFNWYLSILCGTAALWNWYRILCSLFGKEASKQGLYLTIAVPGAWYLFLPVAVSLAAVILCVVLRFGLYIYKRGREGIATGGSTEPLGDALYSVLLSILAVLNGAAVIINLGK